MRRFPFVVLLPSLLIGCAPPYSYTVLSTHTVQVDEKRQEDVVWIADVHTNTILRCKNGPQGPTCAPMVK